MVVCRVVVCRNNDLIFSCYKRDAFPARALVYIDDGMAGLWWVSIGGII